MLNIKEELIKTLNMYNYSIDDISWGWIDTRDNIFNNKNKYSYEFDRTNHNNINDFINSLNIEYNSNHKLQYIYGVIMMNDNTWFERKGANGLEWWAKYCLPISPKEQRKNKRIK